MANDPKLRKHVLVVDDEPEVTFALQAYFLGKGYEMLTALDGMQAMRHIRQHSVDLVLLDMKMPGINGIEVLKFIHVQSPQTKIVVVTAYDVQFQELVERLGVDGFLIKPFGIESMTAIVEKVLAGSSPPQKQTAEESVHRGETEAVPKAKLLFIEPSEYTYKIKEVFFQDSEKCLGNYEVSPAYSVQETMDQLQRMHPDIALIESMMLGHDRDLPVKIMTSPYKPKEIIIHGSGNSVPQDEKSGDLTQQGIKVVYNESFTRAGLLRLGDVIRKTAIANGLIHVRP